MSKKNRQCPSQRVIIHKNPKRGEIWYKKDEGYEGSLEGGFRPCIVVSNNTGNLYAPVVMVVYITTAKKNDMPTHLMVYSPPKPSTVMCEQITTIPKNSLVKMVGKVTEEEMKEVERCMKIALDMK